MRKGQQFKEFQLWIIHDNLHYSRYANFLQVHPCDDDLLKQRFDDAQKLQHLLGFTWLSKAARPFLHLSSPH